MNIDAINVKEAEDALVETTEEIKKLPSKKLSDCDADKTALIIVDMVNGFINEGAMHSERIKEIIPSVSKLLENCSALGISSAAFADCHEKDCEEFKSFPPHCIKGTYESDIVSEIKDIGGYELIEKNSTNGFHEERFRKFLSSNENKDTFIVVGDCTDICVMQFALTLKTYFTGNNKKCEIIIPLSGIETYDSPAHNAAFMNIAAYALMRDSGITFVKEFIYG